MSRLPVPPLAVPSAVEDALAAGALQSRRLMAHWAGRGAVAAHAHFLLLFQCSLRFPSLKSEKYFSIFNYAYCLKRYFFCSFISLFSEDEHYGFSQNHNVPESQLIFFVSNPAHCPLVITGSVSLASAAAAVCL